jgi:hypothetical protein
MFYTQRVVDIPDGKPKWGGLQNGSDLVEDSPQEAIKKRKHELEGEGEGEGEGEIWKAGQRPARLDEAENRQEKGRQEIVAPRTILSNRSSCTPEI